jgi:hypothetical protein
MWAYDDARGGRGRAYVAQHLDHDPQEKKLVPSTILPSMQLTGFAFPQKIYPPIFDTIRRLYGEQGPARLVWFKMERFLSEVNQGSTPMQPPPRHHV